MESNSVPKTKVVCIGAGPSGLTAAYLLSQKKYPVIVLEADPEYVGGISKTVNYKNFLFDIGGHRFFSKSQEIEDLWTEILPEMLQRPRASKIYYRGKFFNYPLKAFEALYKLGVLEAFLCGLSYTKAQIIKKKNIVNFEDWVSDKFGKRLFNMFFKTYTEKVWGMSCKEISADWAAQRIQGLSLVSVIWKAIKPKSKSSSQKGVIKTLIESFRYPPRGPGQMWETARDKIINNGSQILMGCKVISLEQNTDTKLWTVSYKNQEGETLSVVTEHVISSAPLKELVNGITPKMQSLPTANKLKYRDFILVALILEDNEIFKDNWIYIHDPGVMVGRIQNYKSWSPHMVPKDGFCCLGLEYFCSLGDDIWGRADSEILALAKEELVKLKLAKLETIVDGCVVRQLKAYPVYDDTYRENVNQVRLEIESNYPGLHLVGRNGMHKYNNQDHAMMTALLAVKNIVAGKTLFDVWKVNQDAEYQESGSAGGLRMVPEKSR